MRILNLNLILSILIFSSAGNALPQGTDRNKNLRDPLIPLIDTNGKMRTNFEKPLPEGINADILLTGISQINGIFYAFLEGELAKEGDFIKGFTVEKIQADKVILSLNDKKFELKWETEK